MNSYKIRIICVEFSTIICGLPTEFSTRRSRWVLSERGISLPKLFMRNSCIHLNETVAKIQSLRYGRIDTVAKIRSLRGLDTVA